MTARSPCPHGLDRDDCLICRTLAPGDHATARQRERVEVLRNGPIPAPRARVHPVRIAVAVVIVALALWWLVTLFWALVRVVELGVVAVVAGWVGWRLGTRHGRRRR